jgi:Putative MetA-pathway of phenol degradation
MFVRGLMSFVLLSAVTLAGQTSPSAAAPAAQPDGTPRDRNDARFQQMQQELRERDAIIRNLLTRVQELERRVGLAQMGARAPDSVNAILPNSATPTSIPNNDGYNEEDRKARAALDQALIQRGGLLLPSGTFEVDTSLSYYNASNDAISIEGFSILPVLVVGDIVSDRVRREVALSAITTRMGLPWNLQLDVRTPYGYEVVRTVTADSRETTQRSNGLGDVQVSLSRQLTREHGNMPDLLANVTFKTKTGKDPFSLGNNEIALGTGFYGAQGRITAVKASDPMVFFGSLSYAYNFAAGKLIPDPTNPGQKILAHFEPGDTAGFQLGSIMAVNPETSISVGWDQSFTRGTTVNGAKIPGSYLVGGSLRLGTSYVYAPGKNVDLNFGIGLTRDVPNLQFTIGFPLRFTLWKPKPSAN